MQVCRWQNGLGRGSLQADILGIQTSPVNVSGRSTGRLGLVSVVCEWQRAENVDFKSVGEFR